MMSLRCQSRRVAFFGLLDVNMRTLWATFEPLVNGLFFS